MEDEGQIIVETLQEAPKQESQPPAAEPPKAEVNPLKGLTPPMDDAAVRAAIAAAEAKGLDPLALKMSDLEVKKEPAKPEAPLNETRPTVDVPEKFRKPDGEVDVEKLKASTRQLEEAVKAKEQKLQEAAKSIDDYAQQYRELEKKLSSMPNPSKVAAKIQQPVPQAVDPQQLSDEQLAEIVREDLAKDPAGTIAKLTQVIINQKLAPLEEERRVSQIRENMRELAAKDPRVLQPEIYRAITAKLEQEPELLSRKNPHRAAWLEVKEDLRLGDYQSGSPAQPSRPTAPILGGGTPPSTLSVAGTQPTLATLGSLDPRDKKQEAAGDEIMRRYLMRSR